MRFARKLTLLAVVAVAALAAMAPSASALGGIEVKNDATGAHCPVVTGPDKDGKYSGGCYVHFLGTAELTAHFLGFGVHEASCTVEVEIRMDEDGAGVVTKMVGKTPGDANCATVAPSCTDPANWTGSGEETDTAIVTINTTSVCINPAESDTNCQGDFQIEVNTSKEDSLTAATTASQNLGQCEIDFSGSVEHLAKDGSGNLIYNDVHVTHLP
jgi:hypothetical protein